MKNSARLIEEYLQQASVPYVNVADAGKYVASRDAAGNMKHEAGDLRLFHFVIYRENANWLVFVGRPNPRIRKDMREWERLFGDGFIAVFASFGTKPLFVDEDGLPLELPTHFRDAAKMVQIGLFAECAS